MRGRSLALLVVTVSIAACGNTPVPTSARPASPSAVPSTTLPASVQPEASPALPAPIGSRSPLPTLPATAGVYVSPELEVLFPGDTDAFSLDAWLSGTELAIARATVDFGDGSAPVSAKGSCAPGAPTLKLKHVYASSGRHAVQVISADLCSPSAAVLDLSDVSKVLVMPSATAASAGWPTCSTHQLHMTGVTIGAGLGHVGVLIRLQNVSSRGCDLFGYPGIELVSPLGAILPTDVHHATAATGGDYLFPAIHPGRVSLAPGQYAAFDLGYLDNPFGATANQPYAIACPPVRWVRVVLPQTHEFGTASIAMGPCNGWVDVSSVFPGRDWIGFQ